MYNLYLVSNLAVWLQQINKLYLLTTSGGRRIRNGRRREDVRQIKHVLIVML